VGSEMCIRDSNVAQQRKVNVVMSNGFGFGGHNTSVIFKQFIK
jgi:3-oxoacyl-[acyl-carrier-protein] synthase II